MCCNRFPGHDSSSSPSLLPDPDVSWTAFESALQDRLTREVEVLNLGTLQYSPWIDIAELKNIYDPSCNSVSKKSGKNKIENRGNDFGVSMMLALVFVFLGICFVLVPAFV